MHLSRYVLMFAGVLAGTIDASAADKFLKDLSLQQRTAYDSGQAAQGKIKVTIRVDRADLTYVLGQVVHVYVKTSEDAYLMVVDVGPSGKANQLFPNSAQTDNFVKANHEVEIPPPASGLEIGVNPPAGTELLKVVAAKEAAKAILPDLKPDTKDPFPELDGGATALNRLLDVISVETKPSAAASAPDFQDASAAKPDVSIAKDDVATANLIIRSVKSR